MPTVVDPDACYTWSTPLPTRISQLTCYTCLTSFADLNCSLNHDTLAWPPLLTRFASLIILPAWSLLSAWDYLNITFLSTAALYLSAHLLHLPESLKPKPRLFWTCHRLIHWRCSRFSYPSGLTPPCSQSSDIQTGDVRGVLFINSASYQVHKNITQHKHNCPIYHVFTYVFIQCAKYSNC